MFVHGEVNLEDVRRFSDTTGLRAQACEGHDEPRRRECTQSELQCQRERKSDHGTGMLVI